MTKCSNGISSGIWKVIGCVAILVSLAGPVSAQQRAPSPAAIAAAKELLALKKAEGLYENAVATLIQRVKEALIQSNLNYQKDINDVALMLAGQMKGRESEIADEMAKIYAIDFTEQELKEIVAFYKTSTGRKMLDQEGKSINASMEFIGQWASKVTSEIETKIRAEMRKRGKEI